MSEESRELKAQREFSEAIDTKLLRIILESMETARSMPAEFTVFSDVDFEFASHIVKHRLESVIEDFYKTGNDDPLPMSDDSIEA